MKKSKSNMYGFLSVKINALLFVLLLLSLPLKAQKYEYVGVKLGFSPNVTGWDKNTFDINLFFNKLHEPPKIQNFFFGFNFEHSRSKYYSTLFGLDYKFRSYEFDEDKFNQFGQRTGATSTNGDVSYLSFSVSGKFRYDQSKFSFYGIAGLRTDFFIIKSGYMSFLKQNADLNTFMFGLNSGAGIAYGRKHRVSAEFYFLPDFTKHYSSASGSIQYIDYGFSLSYGVVIGSK